MSRKGNWGSTTAPLNRSGTSRTNSSRGQDWQTFEGFKADLNAYITYWNTTGRQKLKDLTQQNWIRASQQAVHNDSPLNASKFRDVVHLYPRGRGQFFACSGTAPISSTPARCPPGVLCLGWL